jgi:hypothetical protein
MRVISDLRVQRYDKILNPANFLAKKIVKRMFFYYFIQNMCHENKKMLTQFDGKTNWRAVLVARYA